MLDGLEPLQHPPGPLAGELKDPAITALLKGLAQRNAGLCVVTTRESVTDLTPFAESTAPKWELEHLSTTAGIALLKHHGVHGNATELEKLVVDVKSHALTLNLIGRFLYDAHGGDVRKRDLVRFEEADAEVQGGHAFRVMAAYEQWLVPPRGFLRRAIDLLTGRDVPDDREGRQQLAILRLLGLFDRPATADCLVALRRPPAIPGLTNAIVGLSDAQWNLSVSRLVECGLLAAPTPSPAGAGEGRGEGGSLDAHPLVREHFARQLRKQLEAAWKAAHSRLFDHLKDATEHWPKDLDGLQPLYQAVVHGCLAGRQQEACGDVYRNRIQRGQEFYSASKLGAFGADLGAVACFFEKPWSYVSPSIAQADHPWLLNEAATRLRALGRLAEAFEPMRASMEMDTKRKDWDGASRSAVNLSQLELTLGDVAGAVSDGEQSVVFADRSGDPFLRMVFRTAHADALHNAGRRDEALARFREAESMQAAQQPMYPLLYSVQGFLYCDLLLADAERRAGVHSGCRGGPPWPPFGGQAQRPAPPPETAAGSRRAAGAPGECAEVERRAEGAQRAWREIFNNTQSILDSALDQLTLGRVRLYRAILDGSAAEDAKAEIEEAVDGLRRAGQIQELPRGLLTRAWLRSATADPDGARADLAEAQEIAERGPMPLFLADVNLYRARLFHDRAALAEARRLVDKHGYGRRLGELEDLEAVADQWQAVGADATSLRG